MRHRFKPILQRLVASFCALVLGVSAAAQPAAAANFNGHGDLAYEADLVRGYSFEDTEDLSGAGASILTHAKGGWLARADWLGGKNDVWRATDAILGTRSLRVSPKSGAAFALFDDSLAQAVGTKRVSVRFWGKSHGAEPTLLVIFEPQDITKEIWPYGAVHVQTIRTGRETSDGWAEYTTGPFDGVWWGNGITGLMFTTRHFTTDGSYLFVDPSLDQSLPGRLWVDQSSYALVDAVEVHAESGASRPDTQCALADADATCGADADCIFGHCVDGAFAWGAVPPLVEQRQAIVDRVAFLLAELSGDRAARARAATAFAATTDLVQTTSPKAFYGGLQDRASATRDRHTGIGWPWSGNSVVDPMGSDWSGPLNLCLGLVQNDLVSPPTQALAVYQVVAGLPTVPNDASVGDIVWKIDDMEPNAWLDMVAARRMGYPPNDPAANPSYRAQLSAYLITRLANSVQFSRCTPGAGCQPQPPLVLAEPIWQFASNKGYPHGSSGVCSQRFLHAVKTPTKSQDAGAVATLLDGTITALEFNGFSPVSVPTDVTQYAAWKAPMTDAFIPGAKVLVDARVGHGGKYALGTWLMQQLRDATQPIATFAMPPETVQNPDSTWLFEQAWDACAAHWYDVDRCAWSGLQMWTVTPTAPGASARIAWLNADDVSMSDIVPKSLQGRDNLMIFGPHPSSGAFGEIAEWVVLPTTWQSGSLQILDTRFGKTQEEARNAPWSSGQGVAPDVVVLQKLSDLLNKKDTALETARAWLLQ